jgi:cell wall-associated NlpC family hydrolase
VFFGCSVNDGVSVKSKVVPNDLVKIPQDIRYYTKDINNSKIYDVQKNYKKSYYSVWNLHNIKQTLKDIEWPFRQFDYNTSYGVNMIPYTEDEFREFYEESNFDSFLSENKKGITLKYSNIRAFPTSKPLFKNPSLAGEGFPFDYLQNSSIDANVPVYLSHYSRSKQWAFVFTGITYGWIKTSDIVLISSKNASLIENAQQAIITKEGVPIFTKDKKPLFNTRIGMMFPIVHENKNFYTILTVALYAKSKSVFHKTVISKDIASKNTLPFNRYNLNNIIHEVSKTKYGWGGLYEQRDCSSTIMDIFAPFGIYLPRNSSNQSKFGKVIKLDGLSDEEKINVIKSKGVPFETLLYKRGHIMLYVGIYKGDIVIYQNVWGIKTKNNSKEGRFIVGKPVFTTLRFGKELSNYDESAELLKNLKSMNILTR